MMNWRKWKVWSGQRAPRALGLDPQEWQAWLASERARVDKKLAEDYAAGRISFVTLHQEREALEEDYQRQAARYR